MSKEARYKRILIYAFRYSLSRMTGAVDDAQEEILENIDLFKDWEIDLLIKEIDECEYYGMECDKASWMNFKEDLVNERNSRRNIESDARTVWEYTECNKNVREVEVGFK